MYRRRLILLLLICVVGVGILFYRTPWRYETKIWLPVITPEPTPQPGSPLLHDVAAPFDWYVWEGYTRNGQLEAAAAYNCGPAVVAMALRYASANSVRVSPETVRSRMPARAGTLSGTVAEDLTSALDYWGVPWRPINSMAEMATAIKNDHIVLVPLAMEAIAHDSTQSAPVSTSGGEQISGRFYAFNGGHWVVAKGLVQDSASGRTYVVTYDPNVWENGDADYYGGDRRYPKGVNRLYPFGELELGYRAVVRNHAIEILATPAEPVIKSLTLLPEQDRISTPEKEPSAPFWCYARPNDTQGIFACADGAGGR